MCYYTTEGVGRTFLFSDISWANLNLMLNASQLTVSSHTTAPYVLNIRAWNTLLSICFI